MSKYALAVAALAAAPALAQDMLAVGWTGEIYAFDSASGATTNLGIGLFGQNCLARDRSGTLWSIAISTVAQGPQFWLSRIDPATATATAVGPTGDIRALAMGSGTALYGLEWFANQNALVELDPATGRVHMIGLTGSTAIQGLTFDAGTLYAWDLVLGLGTIDTTTGAYTDIDPAVGGGNVQWLAVRDSGELIGSGQGILQRIDRGTGAATPYGTTVFDLRGAESSGLAIPFGTPCSGGVGPVHMAVRGTLRPGSTLTSTSIGHSVGTAVFDGLGCLILGTSTSAYRGEALPIDLDPRIGTLGCSLYVSIDATLLGWRIGSTPGSLQFFVPVPPGLGNTTFHLQHAAFDWVPGRMSWSNAVSVHIGL
jgi:hypothetical protein